MKKLLLFFAILLPAAGWAQCDVKTQGTTSIVDVHWFACEGLSSCASISFIKTDSSFAIQVTYTRDEAMSIVCDGNNALLFSLEGGEQMNLFPMEMSVGKIITDGSGNHTTYIGVYSITREQLQKLEDNTITTCVIYHHDGAILLNVKAKKSNAAHEAIEYILK